MEIPKELLYTREHEWARVEGSRVTIGITDYAQGQLGDVVYVELPVKGDRVRAGTPFGVVESVKAVSDLFAPISGEVLEVNVEIADHPEWVNKDPYGKAWLIVVSSEDPNERAALLDASAYETFIAQEES